MKKILLSLSFILCPLSFCVAQNIQLHYDFGRNIYSAEEAGRPKVTATLEQFKPDQWGSWYYFVDVDMSRKFTESAYTEISRELNLGRQSPLAAHIEYNGGLSRSGSFQQSALAGLAYNGHNADFSKTWSLQLLYKRYFKVGTQGATAVIMPDRDLDLADDGSRLVSASYPQIIEIEEIVTSPAHRAYHSLQLTGVWGLNFFDRKLTFSGFIDFWRGEKANGHGQLVVMTEPQLWYNFTSHFSLGTEWEVSDNFIYNVDPTSDKTFFVNPTVALKWNF